MTRYDLRMASGSKSLLPDEGDALIPLVNRRLQGSAINTLVNMVYKAFDVMLLVKLGLFALFVFAICFT